MTVFPFFKKKEDVFLALDIGTETIKGLVFKKNGKKIIILGSSLQYFDRFRVFDGTNLEREVMKNTALEVIQDLEKQFKKMPQKVLLGLPPDILKAQTVNLTLRRKNPKNVIEKKEKNGIKEAIFQDVKKKVGEQFSREFGILPKEIEFVKINIIETKIDGYQVSDLTGYNGRELEFRALTVFLLKNYYENIKRIIKDLGLEVVKISHIAEGLSVLALDKKIDGIFLDVGGEATQIFIVNDGILEGVYDFKIGGKAFTERISLTLGLSSDDSRILKQRYSERLLTEQVRKKIKEVIKEDINLWLSELKRKFSEGRNNRGLFSSDIYLLGGGSFFLELDEFSEEENWKDIAFFDKSRIKFLYPKDLKNIEDETKKIDNPQYTPTLLFLYAGIK